MSEGSLTVFLDTSSLHNDYSLHSAGFEVIASSAGMEGWQLIIPIVVFEELVNQYRESCHKLVKSLQTDGESLNSLLEVLGDRPGAVLHKRTNPELLATRYERWLEKRIRRLGIFIAPYPKIEHVDLVKRDLRRRKPFAVTGKGYRDALIWETILEHCRSSNSSVVFISPNSTDFADGEKLHHDLIQDLTNQQLSPDNITVVNSIKRFIDTYVYTDNEIDRNRIAGFSESIVPEIENLFRSNRIDIADFYLPVTLAHSAFVFMETRDYAIRNIYLAPLQSWTPNKRPIRVDMRCHHGKRQGPDQRL